MRHPSRLHLHALAAATREFGALDVELKLELPGWGKDTERAVRIGGRTPDDRATRITNLYIRAREGLAARRAGALRTRPRRRDGHDTAYA